MLALDDAGLARLCIGAPASPAAPTAMLRDIAHKLDRAVGQAISAARCKSGMPSDVYGARGVFIGMKLDITMR
jgi:hypothetical protein